MNEKEAYQLATAFARVHETREASRTYKYATVPLSAVVGMMMVPVPKDSYLSEDGGVKAVRYLLAEGYRWVRTDDVWAVFERLTPSRE